MYSIRRSRFVRRGAIAGVSLAVGLGAGLGAGVTLGNAFDDGSAAPAAATATTTTSPIQPVALASSSESVAQIAEDATPGVVDIVVSGVSNTSQNGFAPFGQQGQSQAEGSGFVLDTDGHIVTNAHVVDGASTITVRLADGTELKATLVGVDASSDLAVIKVDASKTTLHPLALGSTDDLQVGDGVVAIGSPFGLQGSVTSGIVSALDRSMDAPNGYTITGAIQTDAAINHGNSGGPLLGADGKVVGLNAQIASESGGNDGVGFAIPVETVKSVTSQLIAGGQVQHSYLGVSVTTVDSATATQLGIAAGAQIGTVQAGSPADSAGLVASGSQNGASANGDVITAVNGTAVKTAEELTAAIAALKPGDTVTLTVVRGGERLDVQVTLGTRPTS